MNETIVIRFLKKFSARELTGFGLFVKNRCFNSNKDVERLFHYLEQFAPNFNAPNFTAENAYKEIYPDKAFNRAKLNTLMNQLFKVIKKFISCIYITSNSIEIELNVLRFCNEKFPKWFDNQLRRIKQLLERQEKGADFYYYTLLVEYVLLEYLAIHGRGRNYATFSEVLDKFYWLRKLPLLSEMLNYKGITSDEYDFSKLDAYLTFIEQIEYTKFPLIHLWHSLVSIFKNILDEIPITLQDYFKFKELFLENKNSLDENDKRNLYIYLRNTIKLSSFSDHDYYREEFEIDQMGLEEKLIFLDGFLREHSIKNIVNSALKVGEIEWAKKFLEEYKDLFWKEFANDVFLYCTAIIDFYEGNYDKALKHFNDVEYRSIFFEIEKRIKLIQIYYETDEFELFDNHTRNLTVFISRNQNNIGNIFTQSYRAFIKFIKKIANTPTRDTDEIQKLEKEISEIPVRLLFEKKWLLEKLDKLK